VPLDNLGRMSDSPIDAIIDDLWDRRDTLSADDADARKSVVAAVDLLDTGQARVASIDPAGQIVVDERAKRAILLSFKVLPMAESAAGDFQYHDRVPLKTTYNGVRVVPGAIARWGSYLAPGVVLMPSYTNIGAYVGSGTLVDTWATVGSCAQVGERVHLSGGVGLGGVLEPPQAAPVIVEVLESSLKRAGYQVRRNKPFAGGYITEHFGAPADGAHAVQIEIARALYLDERRIVRTEGWSTLQEDLFAAAKALALELGGKSEAGRLAAE